MDVPAFERHLAHLRQDFHIDTDPRKAGDAYRLVTSRPSSGKATTRVTRRSSSQPRSASRASVPLAGIEPAVGRFRGGCPAIGLQGRERKSSIAE